MIIDEYNEFAKEWQSVCDVSANGKKLTNENLSFIFRELIEYPIEHVIGALKIHAKQSKYAPTIADIVNIIDRWTSCKHLGADEAWTIVSASFNEFETVDLTQEMQDARKIVSQIWAYDDQIGARMAFREAYSRIIEKAGKPKWKESCGFDKQKRLEAIESAKQLGRLPSDYSPNPNLLPEPRADVSVLNLLEMADKKTSEDDKATNLSRIREIRKIKENLMRKDSHDVEENEKVRKLFEIHREAELSKIDKKLKKSDVNPEDEE